MIKISAVALVLSSALLSTAGYADSKLLDVESEKERNNKNFVHVLSSDDQGLCVTGIELTDASYGSVVDVSFFSPQEANAFDAETGWTLPTQDTGIRSLFLTDLEDRQLAFAHFFHVLDAFCEGRHHRSFSNETLQWVMGQLNITDNTDELYTAIFDPSYLPRKGWYRSGMWSDNLECLSDACFTNYDWLNLDQSFPVFKVSLTNRLEKNLNIDDKKLIKTGGSFSIYFKSSEFMEDWMTFLTENNNIVPLNACEKDQLANLSCFFQDEKSFTVSRSFADIHELQGVFDLLRVYLGEVLPSFVMDSYSGKFSSEVVSQNHVFQDRNKEGALTVPEASHEHEEL